MATIWTPAHTEIVAAHFIGEYVDVDDLKYPTRRSVFTLKPDGTLDRDFNAVTIRLSEYALFRDCTSSSKRH